MAERRMFANTIIGSDAFTDMPLTAQALYLHLAMQADDDGFINSPKKIQRMVGASDDDLKALIESRFILSFDSGVVVIKHWKIHNYIRKDRKKDTHYSKEMALITEKSNGIYTLSTDVSQMSVKCQSSDGQVTDKCQHRLGKDSIGEYRIGQGSIGESKTSSPPFPSFYGKYNNVLLSDDELETLKKDFPDDYDKRIDKLSAYMHSTGKRYENCAATIQYWAEQDKEKQKNEKQTQNAPSGSNPFLNMARDKGLI